MKTSTFKYFKYDHLPEGDLRETSKKVAELAEYMQDEIPDSDEKEAGMRKLLEAKDCFVRACLKD